MNFRSACSHHIYRRKKLFDSLESSEGTIYLSDGSSCVIKDTRTINLQIHDGAVKKLGDIQYIPNFRSNLILLCRLNLRNYRWGANDGVLIVLYGSRVVLKRKKCKGHYLFVGRLV